MNTIVLVMAVLAALFLLRGRGGVKPEVARDALREGGRLIDVRTPDEYNRGHVGGALNLPLDELAERLPREIPDRATPLLLHCASGARSALGKRTAERLGYQRVMNVGSYGRALKLSRTP